MAALDHRLVFPDTVLAQVQRMRYTGHEKIDHYLSLYLIQRSRADTIPLTRVPMGVSPGTTVAEDSADLQVLGRFIDARSLHAEVLLHFHPIQGPSQEDAELMAARFQQNSRLSRYGIFVGPEGPVYYETDGSSVFPIRSPVSTIPISQFLRTQQQRLLDQFSAGYK